MILIALGALATLGTVAVVAAKRQEARPDPPGVASVALLRGGDAYLDEGEREEDDVDARPPGRGVIEAILGALVQHGFTAVGELATVVGGYEAEVRRDDDLIELALGVYDDDTWSLHVSDRHGGPPPPAVLPRVAEALATLDRLRDIRWITRQQAARGAVIVADGAAP